VKTRTYAEILARQGEFGEALAIYRYLAMRAPADASLEARIGELEALLDPAQAPVTAASPEGTRNARRRAVLETLLQRIRARSRA